MTLRPCGLDSLNDLDLQSDPDSDLDVDFSRCPTPWARYVLHPQVALNNLILIRMTIE